MREKHESINDFDTDGSYGFADRQCGGQTR